MLVDARAVSEALGVSQELLRKLAREKKIPFYRLSPRTLRFDLNEVRDHMRMIAEGNTRADSDTRHG
jgi:excisionase family DNA binding protein